MSRSTKKPFFTDQQMGRKSRSSPSKSSKSKRDANRAVRSANKKACQEVEKDTLYSGRSYRKASCSWNIRDWSFYCPKIKKAYRK